MGGGEGGEGDPGAGGDDRANLMEAIRQAGELARPTPWLLAVLHGCIYVCVIPHPLPFAKC